MIYTFTEFYGSGPKVSGSVTFDVELTESEVLYLKTYIKDHGPDCRYELIESDDSELFWKINDAANHAIIDSINQARKQFHDEESDGEYHDLDIFDIDWGNMYFELIWPEKLVKEL